MLETVKGVSVVICAYTEERWCDLVAAVESLQQQILPPLEIIVVIDHNASLFSLAQRQLSGVIVTENSLARGLSGARNHGIAIAKGNFVAFLDDDAVAEPDWLQRLSQHCEDPQVLGAGGSVEPYWLSKQPGWFPEEFYWVVGCSYSGLPQALSVVRNPYGGCTCFRREVFEVVGGFREGIGRVGSNPMGGEETELCIRAKQQCPYKVFLYDPSAKIFHRVSSSRASWRYFAVRCYAEGTSKATITKLLGVKGGLASERAYILFTLPKGVARGIVDGLFRLDLTGFLRAGAIIAGLAITTMGYLIGSISLRVMHKEVNTSSDRGLQEVAMLK
jgi:glucosyl-dolichyl phosphate glucuronosyltransferase